MNLKRIAGAFVLFFVHACNIDENKDRLAGRWVVEKIENDNEFQAKVRVGTVFNFGKSGSFLVDGKWQTTSSDTIQIIFRTYGINDFFQVSYQPKQTLKPWRVFLQATNTSRESYQLKRNDPNLQFLEPVKKEIMRN